MKANVGNVDRVIRFVLAALLFSLFFLLPGDQKWFGLLGLVPLATGLVSWCPVYKLFGVQTCSV
jgi:cadmium resistance protein CadD (predicted permease)